MVYPGARGGWGLLQLRALLIPTLATQDTFLWAPPPAAAYAAVDELALSRHKRTHLHHIFVYPRLCTHMWQKKLYKTADHVLELPPCPGLPWTSDMYEPLILAFVLPFVSFPPWELRSSAPVLELGQQMQGVWKTSEGDGGLVLWELCIALLGRHARQHGAGVVTPPMHWISFSNTLQLTRTVLSGDPRFLSTNLRRRAPEITWLHPSSVTLVTSATSLTSIQTRPPLKTHSYSVVSSAPI